MSAVPCRFGAGCTRADCWFQHPPGRNVGGGGGASSGSSSGAHGGSGGGGGGGPKPCFYGRSCTREGCYFAHPDGRDMDEHGPPGGLSAGPGANRKPVAPVSPNAKSDFNPDDWEGPDGDEEEGGDFDPSQFEACECCGGNPFNCQTPSCKAAGRCGCMLDEAGDDADEEADDSWRDEWFPQYRECPCCAGSIYRCQKQQADCVSGNCFCSLQKGANGVSA